MAKPETHVYYAWRRRTTKNTVSRVPRLKHVTIVPHVSQHASSCLLLLAIVPPLHMGGRTLGLHALRSASSSEAQGKFCYWPWSLRYTWVAARSGFMPSTARAPVKLGTMCRPVNFQDLIDRPQHKESQTCIPYSNVSRATRPQHEDSHSTWSMRTSDPQEITRLLFLLCTQCG